MSRAGRAIGEAMRKRMFSGIQPTGNIHLGNFLGAIRNWIPLQEEYECLFCIVDLHAITVPRKPEVLRQDIRETAGILLASGIDPEKSTLFVQSNVCAHSELTIKTHPDQISENY